MKKTAFFTCLTKLVNFSILLVSTSGDKMIVYLLFFLAEQKFVNKSISGTLYSFFIPKVIVINRTYWVRNIHLAYLDRYWTVVVHQSRAKLDWILCKWLAMFRSMPTSEIKSLNMSGSSLGSKNTYNLADSILELDLQEPVYHHSWNHTFPIGMDLYEKPWIS